jgi:hypothetical protein
VKTIWETEPVDEFGAVDTVTPARHAERVRESVPDVCRWPTMAIRDMTMVDADGALAADPLFHLSSDGHLGRVDVRYWYFRPELKYLTCRACSEGGDPSAIEPEAVGCQHRIPPNGILVPIHLLRDVEAVPNGGKAGGPEPRATHHSTVRSGKGHAPREEGTDMGLFMNVSRAASRPVATRVLARMATSGIYLVRGVPRPLQRAARVRAVSENTTLRWVLVQTLREYAAGTWTPRPNDKSPESRP